MTTAALAAIYADDFNRGSLTEIAAAATIRGNALLEIARETLPTDYDEAQAIGGYADAFLQLAHQIDRVLTLQTTK